MRNSIGNDLMNDNPLEEEILQYGFVLKAWDIGEALADSQWIIENRDSILGRIIEH